MDNNYYRCEKDLRGNLMEMNIITVARFALGHAMTFLLIAFAIWVYRKIELRSLPWAVAYLILGMVYGILFLAFIKPHLTPAHQNLPLAQYLSFTKAFSLFFVSNSVWGGANYLLIVLLLLADCTVLITKAGGNLTGKFANFWRWIYDKSTILGCVLIASILLRIIWSVVLWQIF